MPRPPVSYVDRLRSELDDIAADIQSLLDRSAIRYVNPNTGDSSLVFVTAADWGWSPSDAATSAEQMRIGATYAAWFDRLSLIFAHPTPEVAANLASADEFVRRWVFRPDRWDHSIPRSIELAKERASAELASFYDVLEVAANIGSDLVRLVPDTNALIRNPDLASYARCAPSKTFIVDLLPTVLGELDDLKELGKTPELRDKAQAVVRRLKGLRDKGSLSDGVKLTKAITVRAEAREIDVASVLAWLDPAVPDDRILAGALRLQGDNPAGTVVLVTSDLNLQNKADAAGLPYLETPPTTDSLRANLKASIQRSTPLGPLTFTLTNAGPAVAREITYSISTPPGAGPPVITNGPWTQDRLERDGTVEQQVAGLGMPHADVTASWTDDDGKHTKGWPVDVPDPPARRVRRPSARR